MSNQVKRLTLSAFFLALGLVLPFAFHSFGPQAGAVFLPMHIPVLLCGFVCGPAYGALVGVVTPLLSSALTGMPPLMPTGIAMCLELAAYGLLSGFITKKLANLVLLSVAGKAYTLHLFLTAAFITAIPGILLQLVIVPLLVSVVKKVEVRKAED